MKQCIFILGMHRSGTSALGGVLSAMGLDIGTNLMLPDSENPKGYFENNFIYEFNKNVLRGNNSSWDDYCFRIDNIEKSKIRSYVDGAKEIIESEFKDSNNFVIKDPRNCLLFPIWEKACVELEIEIKIILPYRNPFEVAVSLNKRNGFSEEKSLLLWTHHFLSAEKYSLKYNRIFLAFDDLVNDTNLVSNILGEFANVRLTKKRRNNIGSFIDKKIKHNNISIQNSKDDVPSFVRDLITLIREQSFDHSSFKEISREFYFSLNLFQNVEIKNIQLEFEQLSQQQAKLIEDRDLLLKAKESDLFDKQFYLTHNEDVKESGMDPFEHFIKFGREEGRKPNSFFDFYERGTKEIASLKQLLLDKEKEYKEELQAKDKELTELTINYENTSISLKTKELLFTEKQKEYKEELQQKEIELTKLLINHEILGISLKSKEQEFFQKHEEVKSKDIQINELINNYDSAIANLKLEASKLQEEKKKNIELIEEVEEERKIVAALKEKNAKAIKESKSQLAVKESTISEFKKVNKSLTETLRVNKREVIELNQRINEILEDLAVIKESKSWKYTKLFREIKTGFKKRDNG